MPKSNVKSVWLTQEQMSKLFGKAKSTINEHIKNVYKEGELIENETMTKFGNSEFVDKPTNPFLVENCDEKYIKIHNKCLLQNKREI